METHKLTSLKNSQCAALWRSGGHIFNMTNFTVPPGMENHTYYPNPSDLTCRLEVGQQALDFRTDFE